ncbi:MAG: hypothetical protein AAF639_00525 [Chloroflexota bacterium]
MDQVAELNVTDEMMMNQIHFDQVPLRINRKKQTYYILTEAQVMALMQPPPDRSYVDVDYALNDDYSFTPEDIGLTEDEMKKREEASRARAEYVQEKLGGMKLKPMDIELKNRLDMLKSLSATYPSIPAIDEPTLQALEEAMLNNLKALVPTL